MAIGSDVVVVGTVMCAYIYIYIYTYTCMYVFIYVCTKTMALRLTVQLRCVYSFECPGHVHHTQMMTDSCNVM